MSVTDEPIWKLNAKLKKFSKLRRTRRRVRMALVEKSAISYRAGAHDALRFMRTYSVKCSCSGDRIMFSFTPNGHKTTAVERAEAEEIVRILSTRLGGN